VCVGGSGLHLQCSFLFKLSISVASGGGLTRYYVLIGRKELIDVGGALDIDWRELSGSEELGGEGTCRLVVGSYKASPPPLSFTSLVSQSGFSGFGGIGWCSSRGRPWMRARLGGRDGT
jgi:hypothetical protein